MADRVLGPNEEELDVQAENLEDAIEIAKLHLPEGSQIYLITDDPEGNEILLPIEVEKKDAN